MRRSAVGLLGSWGGGDLTSSSVASVRQLISERVVVANLPELRRNSKPRSAARGFLESRKEAERQVEMEFSKMGSNGSATMVAVIIRRTASLLHSRPQHWPKRPIRQHQRQQHTVQHSESPRFIQKRDIHRAQVFGLAADSIALQPPWRHVSSPCGYGHLKHCAESGGSTRELPAMGSNSATLGCLPVLFQRGRGRRPRRGGGVKRFEG